MTYRIFIALLATAFPVVAFSQEPKSDFWKSFEAELGKAAAQALVGAIRDVANAPPKQRTQPAEQFSVLVNKHGAVFSSSSDTLYLGKDCDAESKHSGKGRWTWGPNGVVVTLEKRRISFDSLRASPTGSSLCGA